MMPFRLKTRLVFRLAKMRRNTGTYWSTVDLTNRATCSFIRLHDPSRKTLLQAAKKISRNLTDHGKQLLPCALISTRLFDHRDRIMGNDRGRRGEGVEKDVTSIINT